MPGLWQSWPEGAFYGFDDDLRRRSRLDYHGPQFGWWGMTDQFAMAKMDALEVSRAPRAPLFVFFPTISTHTPFTPTPPYQPDWRADADGQPYEAAGSRARVGRRARLDEPRPGLCAGAVSYVVRPRRLSAHARRSRLRDDPDRRSSAAGAGERRGRAVGRAVHVIASRANPAGRPAVLDACARAAFRSGLTPQQPKISKMHELVPILLNAFSGDAVPVDRTGGAGGAGAGKTGGLGGQDGQDRQETRCVRSVRLEPGVPITAHH